MKQISLRGCCDKGNAFGDSIDFKGNKIVCLVINHSALLCKAWQYSRRRQKSSSPQSSWQNICIRISGVWTNECHSLVKSDGHQSPSKQRRYNTKEIIALKKHVLYSENMTKWFTSTQISCNAHHEIKWNINEMALPLYWRQGQQRANYWYTLIIDLIHHEAHRK